MERMGWRDGRGLGANEDGISNAIQVSFRQVDDKRGVQLCTVHVQLFSLLLHLASSIYQFTLMPHAFVASLFRLGIGANGLGADLALEGIRTYDQILRNLTEFNSNSLAGAASNSNSPVSSSDSSSTAAAADGTSAPEQKHKRHSHKHKRATDSGLEPGSLSHATPDTDTLPEASAKPSATATVSRAVELEPAEQQLPALAPSPSLSSFSAASEGSSSASASSSPVPSPGSPSAPAPAVSHPHPHAHSSSLSSLCERARRSRTLRFSKVVRGKDLSTRSARELLGVLGLAAYPTVYTSAVAEPVDANASASASASLSPSACASGTETTTPVPVADESTAKATALVSLVPTYTSGVSVADYFKRLSEKRKLASAPLPLPLHPYQLFESEYGLEATDV